MEKNKEKIIKALLGELFDSNVEQKFAEAFLEDGTKLSISELAVGGSVSVLDENGTEAPIFDGSHKLKDGSEIITIAGKITEVKPKAEEAPVADAAMADVVVPSTDVVAPAADIAPSDSYSKEEIDAKFNELYKALADIKTLVEADAAEDVTEIEAPVMMHKMSAQDALASFIKNMK